MYIMVNRSPKNAAYIYHCMIPLVKQGDSNRCMGIAKINSNQSLEASLPKLSLSNTGRIIPHFKVHDVDESSRL